jgi:3-isopropylmalate/(R)-2-methylmalate dehydratase small subunit
LIIKGPAVKLPDNINTDYIIAGKYTKTMNMDDLARHLLEDLDPSLGGRVRGRIIAAGHNFGCGSSREQAPLAVKHAGALAVVAKSFSRIFFRNAVNIGLPALVGNTEGIEDGDELEINVSGGKICNLKSGELIECSRLPPIMLAILTSGGLVEYLRARKSFD